MRSAGLALAWLLAAGLPAGAQGTGADYEIGSGDTIHVIVLDQAGLTGDFAVDREGMVTYPFLGKFKAAGMTAPELERKLATLLSEGYLRRPRVSVSLKEFGSQTVFVTGEFQKPGPYALKQDRSLLALLGDVGELTPNAGHEIVVIRPPDPTLAPPPLEEGIETPPEEAVAATGPPLPGEVPGAEIFRIGLRDLRAGYPEKNVLLKARDTVYVPKAAMVYVLGHVARPGPYRYEEGLTVYQALLQAGGVSDRGSEKGVRIVRLVDGKTRELKPRMDEPVLPEDTIRVPERFF